MASDPLILSPRAHTQLPEASFAQSKTKNIFSALSSAPKTPSKSPTSSETGPNPAWRFVLKTHNTHHATSFGSPISSQNKHALLKPETAGSVALAPEKVPESLEQKAEQGAEKRPNLQTRAICSNEDHIHRPEPTFPQAKTISLPKQNIRRKEKQWFKPPLELLKDPVDKRQKMQEKDLEIMKKQLLEKLFQFSVKGSLEKVHPGPAVTLFEFKPNVDVKISKITELADDLCLALSSESVRIIAPIPGRNVVGIETANSHREMVFLKESLAHRSFWQNDIVLPLSLGKDVTGNTSIVDLQKIPHLMVAGTTGSGKSVFVVSAVCGLIYKHSPEKLRLLLIDPKQVDLAGFQDIPHLISPIVNDVKKALLSLKWAIREMEKRYRSMTEFSARSLDSFNKATEGLTKEQKKFHEEKIQELKRSQKDYYCTPQPYIVIVIEEFGDLMATDKNAVEASVVRLAQMSRACGIHLILAMQSPRKDVVTGLIKTNIPGRISFKVASKMDSRIILDDTGGERLLARGDLLMVSPSLSKPTRYHAPFLEEAEVFTITGFWKNKTKIHSTDT